MTFIISIYVKKNAFFLGGEATKGIYIFHMK